MPGLQRLVQASPGHRAPGAPGAPKTAAGSRGSEGRAWGFAEPWFGQ